MKFLRFGPKGQEKPGILFDDGTIRDLSAHTPDFGGVTVSIEDTGKGMDKGVLDKIFDPFYTTKSVDDPNGMGLGLSQHIYSIFTGSTLELIPARDRPLQHLVYEKVTR